MSDNELINVAEEAWVTIREAMELTTYNRRSLHGLIQRMIKLPEDQREIRVRQRLTMWEIWLPDLYAYMGGKHRGPKGKHKQDT